mmetsp:Transcript_37969/g.98258  ORF Transcript_37969/g.98258 Transcript_37969/m.98258 type:complete len:374 (-) Transcript_37969:105-1226(-)
MAVVARITAAMLALLALPAIARDLAMDDVALAPEDPQVDASAEDPPLAVAQKHHHRHHRHHHHHRRHHKHNKEEEEDAAPVAQALANTTAPAATAPRRVAAQKATTAGSSVVISNVKRVADAGGASEDAIVAKMKVLETKLAAKEKAVDEQARRSLRVNGPLPTNFNSEFALAVAEATKCDPAQVKVVGALPAEAGVVQVLFEAPASIADEAVDEASDPDSKLARGPLQKFLVERAAPEEAAEKEEAETAPAPDAASGPKFDIDTQMPYGDLEPFGREDTAQELTESSVKESNEMVDQLERAEVAEEKRAVFRALTRLRGAAVTSFDGIARAQTGNIDEYNKVNKWRDSHPIRHLADEESDVSKWAFPNNADF